MTVVKWGILGAAKFARQFMGPAIHAASGAELAALATSSPEKADGFAVYCPSLRVHKDYDALLADPEIDAIYVPLPNHLHVDWSIKAAEAGKHVLCEKPIAMRTSDFDRLIAARESTGKLIAEAYMIVHHAQWHYVRELVQGGAIGKLWHIGGRFTYDNRADTQNIRNRAETGGGGLRDIGVYVLGAARFVTGLEGDDITSAIRWENEVDVFTQIGARFGDASYSAYVSTRMQSYQEMLFHGDQGVIRVTAPFNPRVYGEATVELHKVGHVGGGNISTQRFPAEDHYVRQVEAFGLTVLQGAEYPCPLEFSRGTQVMIDRVFEVATTL